MSQAVDNIIITYHFLIFAIAFFGNVTAAIVILLYQDLQSTTNFYVLNLVVADILICVTTVPSRMMFVFKNSLLTCKINTFLWIFFFNASVFAIFLIGFDRYVFICKPLYYRQHFIVTRIKYWISVSWVAAFFLAILPFLSIPNLAAQQSVELEGTCSHKFLIGDWYLFFLIILTEIFPPFAFCLLYGKIITVARRHAFEIAVQYSKSKPLTVDGRERRRFTDSLVSPFENPSCLFEATGTENEELSKLRRVLYKNYEGWRQKVREEGLRQTEGSGSKENSEAVVQNEKLSQVGRKLSDWKNRATTKAGRRILENFEQANSDVVQSESWNNRRKWNHVGPTEAESRRHTGVTERYRPAGRAQTRISQSVCIVEKKDKVDQPEEIQNNCGKSKRQNQVGAFLVQQLSKLSASTRKRRSKKRSKLKIYKEFKAVKMLGMVVGMFALLHLPIAIIDLIDLFGGSSIVPKWIITVAILLAQLSPTVNILIYVVTKREFRYAFVRLWTCGRIKKRLAHC